MSDINQEDVNLFNAKLLVLLTEFNFNLGAEALIQDGKIVSKVIVIPKKPTPTPKKVPEAPNASKITETKGDEAPNNEAPPPTDVTPTPKDAEEKEDEKK